MTQLCATSFAKHGTSFLTARIRYPSADGSSPVPNPILCSVKKSRNIRSMSSRFASLRDLDENVAAPSSSPTRPKSALNSKAWDSTPTRKLSASLSLSAALNSTHISTGTDQSNGTKQVLTKKLKDPIVWIDLEMTGLDINTDTIIEIACIVTDGSLEIQIEGPVFAIHQDDDVLASMNAWCIEHHGDSGLTQRCRESTVSMAQAEAGVLEFIQQYVPLNGAPLAGNSVHVDRMFLNKYMPEFLSHLHYRIIDVSSIGELAKRWYTHAWAHAPRKAMAHTAMSDIRESIKELQYYQGKVFRPKGGK